MATQSGAYGANDTAVESTSGAYSPNDQPADLPAPEPASKIRRVADTGLALGKGIVALPESAVGISNLITGGRTGKAVERLGVRFKDAKQVLSDFQSEEQKAADAAVQQAEGFFPTVGAMIQNPSTIANAVAESAPSMLAGGAMSQGMVRRGVEGITAGAVGEGLVSAGQAAEQVRQETATGFLTPKQAALAATSGAVTGLINRASGRLANELGIADVNTAMATGKLGGATERGVVRRVAYGAANEGVLQELPQSMQEQAAQNLALDKPIGEGVAQAGAAGMLVGGLTGGGFGALSGGPTEPAATPGKPRLGDTVQKAPEGGVIPSGAMGGFAPPEQPPKQPSAAPQTASQSMGINPAAGPISSAAAVTVDTGADVVTQQQEVQKQQDEAAAKEKAKPGNDGKKPAPEAPAPVMPAPANPAAPITGPFTQAIHGGSNVAPTPSPVEPVGGPAAAPAAAAPIDARAAPGAGADQGPAGASAVPAAVPEPVPAATPAPVTQPTQESTNATQQAVPSESIDQETGEITQSGPQGASGDGLQRPADAIDPGADAKGPQPAAPEPAAPAAASTAPEGKPAAPVEPLDLGAHTAATSPHNNKPEPTPAQKEAGNYKKAHLVINGVGISVENPQGSVRSGTDADGKAWSNTMQWHYGYAKRTTGSDDEQQDVFVKPGTPLDYTGSVFVVDQVDPKTGKHDEYKSMVGAKSPMEARKAYMDHYSKGWKGLKNVTALSWDQWREWLQAPKGTAPGSLAKDAALDKGLPDGRRGDASAAGNLGQGSAGAKKTDGGSNVPGVGAVPSIGGGDSPTDKSVSDGGKRDAQLGGNVLQTGAGVAQGDGGVDRPGQSSEKVGTDVLGLSGKNEVVDGVVQPVLVPVVDDLGGKQSTADSNLHDKPVLKPLASNAVDADADKPVGGLVTRKGADVSAGAGGQDGAPESKPNITPDKPQGKGLRVGTMPNTAEPVTIKDGILHIGKYPALNFDTGEPVKIAQDANGLQIRKALADNKVLGAKQKVFGGSAEDAPAPAAAPDSDPAAGKWYGSKEKATEKLAALGLTDTHEVVRDGLRFELRKKAPAQKQDEFDAAAALNEAPVAIPSEFDERPLPVPMWWEESTPAQRVFKMKASGFRNYTAATPWNRLPKAEQQALNDQWGPKAAKPVTPQIAPPLAPEAYTPPAPPGAIGVDDVVYAVADGKRGVVKRFLMQRGNVMVLWDGASQPLAYPVAQLTKEPPAAPARVTVVSWNAATPAERRVMLANVGYTDKDQARVLSGAEWSGLTDTVRKALEGKAKPAPTVESTLYSKDAKLKNPQTLDELIGAADAGYRVHFDYAGADGRTLWLEKSGDAWVMKSRDDGSNATITKGGAGVAQWGKAQALDAVERDANYRFNEWKPLVEKAPAPADDLNAMFNDVLGEELAKDAAKAPPAPKNAGFIQRNAESSKPRAPAAPRTAPAAVASAAKNVASGLTNAIDGLGALFGGKGRLGSGLSFDEDTYAKAKPLFQAAIANLKDAGSDLREAMRTVIRMVLDKFGADTAKNMQPYVVRFIGDMQALETQPEKAQNEGEAPNDSATQGPGSKPLENLPPDQVGGAGGGRPGGSGTDQRGNASGDANPDADAEGGQGGRGAGDGAARPDLPAAGDKRPGSGVRAGGGRSGGRVPGNGRKADVGVSAGSDGAGPGQPVAPAGVPAANFEIDAELQLGSGGESVKYRDNLAAIQTLKKIESEHRRATAAEKRILARYVGWGSLPNAFRNPVTGAFKEEWKSRIEELESLMTPKELKAARASTPNAHYTSATVVDFMWRAAQRIGFGGGLVLESSVGSGNFIGLMPQPLRAGTRVTGVELDSVTARIAGALYPQSNIVESGFDKLPMPEDTFDMAIGNPPFGNISLRFQYNPKLNGKSIHNQFFLGSMDAVKPGGLQVMVVSRFLMDAKTKESREALAVKSELLGAIRLPGSAFKGNAGTSVVTDILFLRKRSDAEASRMVGLMAKRGAKVPANEAYADRLARREDERYLAQQLRWTETGTIKDPLGGEPMEVSQYYVDNPQMIAGVMDRSGSQQHDNDLDVKLPAAELAAKLDSLITFLPDVQVTLPSDDVQARTDKMHKALGESLSIMASGREVGSIYYDESGDLVEIIERVAENGRSVVTKLKITADSPWSSQLAMNMDGQWFKEVQKLNEKGEKVKLGNRNVMVREVYAKVSDIPNTLRLGENRLSQLKKLVEIRELYVQQINLETNAAQPAVMEANRSKLRTAYEQFVKEHGYLNDPKNSSIISEMPDEGLILSLELKYRPAITLAKAKRTGMKPAPARAEPNAILSRAVSIPRSRQESASSMSDAVAIVLGELGKVDAQRIAALRSMTEDEVVAELTTGDNPLAYMDPETNELTEKNQYLSGNVRRKLQAARDANLSTNIKALEAIQPEPWSSDKVTARLGATWVPPEVYSAFVDHLLGEQGAHVTFSKVTNVFDVHAKQDSTQAMNRWGTPRVPAPSLLRQILNSQRIVVYDTDSDGSRHLNETETQSANDKKAELVEEFDGWIFKDADRRQALTQIFNDLYNTRVNRQYDGSHMMFPGKVPDEIIKFRRNQINAIWRGVVDRFTLYDHAVGAGKTFTGIARAIERRRMGLSRKPMIVVPNHLVAEWATQAYRLYPGAKILSAGVRDLMPRNRRRLFAKIAAGEWDIVIVPHSSFKFIGIAPETEERYLDAEIRVAQKALEEAEAEREPGQFHKPLSVKAAEALIKKLEGRLDVVRGKAGKDKLLTFEQMGVDDLTVDESHEFKNLTYTTRLTDVRGLGPATGSQKAFDLYTKMRVLHENGGSGLFMSGTPISNSAVEMYTIMRYLAPDILQEHGLEHFDAFRAQFVDATEKMEPTEAGNGLKVVNRLGRNWSNMRALMDGYYSVSDVVTNEDIQAWYKEDNPGQEFPLPKVKGGKRRVVKVQPTPTQQALLEQVIFGYETLRGISDVKERNKERLRLMTRARKVSLHARVLEPTAADEPGSKLDAAVDEAMRIYKQWESDLGTQLFFLDRSVPKAKGDDKVIKEYDALREKLAQAQARQDEEGQRKAIEALEKFDADDIAELRAAQAGGWNAYQHMADLLVSKGVPRTEIAFIQNYNSDAEKKVLFEAVNEGSVRFLFGSSQRMGAGMNVQERLVGLHHVDVGWKPSDIEQREGRIIRQGNALREKYGNDFEVEIMAYVTERSIDAKMWDLNSTKLRMVNGIRYYDGEFEMDFEDDEAIDMAEIAAIASGDPLMLDRIRLNTIIEDLYRKRRSYNRRIEGAEDSLRRAQRDIDTIPGQLETARALVEPATAAIRRAAEDQEGRSILVGDIRYTELVLARAASRVIIDAQKKDNSKAPFEIEIDGKTYTSEDAVDDALADKMGDVEPFLAEIDGQKVIRRTTVARKMRAIIGDTFSVIGKWTPVGNMYGMPLSIMTDSRFGKYVYAKLDMPYGDKSEAVVLQREITPDKHKSGTPVPVNTFSLRALVESLSNRVQDMRSPRLEYQESELKKARDSLPGLREAMQEKFKHADELDQALLKLQDVEAQLAARASGSAPTAAPEPAESVSAVIGNPPFDTYQRLQVGGRHMGQMGFNSPDTRFARGKRTTGVHMDDAEAIISQVREALPTAPPIIPLESIAQAPADLRKFIKASGAENDFQAAYHNGKIYILPSNVGSTTRLQFLLAHHEIRHHGLASMLGPRKNAVMFAIHATNANVRAAAAEQVRKGYATSKVLATEEALADMAVEDIVRLNGFDRIVAAVREWLRGAAVRLRKAGLLNVADRIDAMPWTDLDVASLIARAEGVSRGGAARYATEGTVFGRGDIASAQTPGSWDAPEPSKFDDLVYTLQDKQIDTKRVVQAIRKSSQSLADEADVYLQEELFHGRAAKRTQDFVDRELRPMLGVMQLAGVTVQQLDKYLHARHAEEANELIKERNPAIMDAGSGMTTGTARAYLAKLDPNERRHLEAIASRVDAIIASTRDLYVAYGLEPEARVNSWAAMFRSYVPLMREDHDGAMGIGQGFSIRGRESKGRTGSANAKVIDILANIAMQRERAIVRGEKNRVSTALVGLAEMNPNPDFWSVGPPPPIQVYNPKTNLVEDRVDPLFKSRDNVIVAKVVQADGSVAERAVVFNEGDERAVRMAKSLKNLDTTQLEGLLGTSAKVSRYFAAINTQYNPIFGTVNLVRDVQGALINLSSTSLAGHGKEIAGHTLSALRGIYIDARDERKGIAPTSAWAALWSEFQEEGGQTGFRDLYRTSKDRADAIERELDPTKWMESPLGKFFTAGGRLKVPLAIAQKGATGIFGWLSDYNLAMENAVRLAAYKTALEQGMSKQQAASLGKNLTVNFNRKGQVGQQAGALYAFFNAAVQGTARLGQTLFDMDGSDPSTIRLSRSGKKIVYGGVLLGSMQALLLAAAGFDDEEPPDFVRERSLIIPTGGKSYITIPMPLGLHVLPNLGRIPTEFALGGFKKPVHHLVKLLGLTVDAFNPVGGGASVVQAMAPTAIDPIVALAENRDWTGKPIAKVSFNKATPGHALAKDTASGPAKMLSEAINYLSGGTEHVRGVFSPTPDQIDYLWGQVTGGVGREAAKLDQTVSAAFTGEELPPHKIPLIGRFYGNADAQSSQSGSFYANLNRINEHEAEVKGLRKAGQGAEAAEYIRANPEARFILMANAAERQIQKLRVQKRDLLAKDAPDEQVREVERQISEKMRRFNEAVKGLKQAA